MLGLLEATANGVTAWTIRKGWKKWRYGLVLCVVMYCLILSVSIYILHETMSTLDTIKTELADSCESSRYLGSLQLAYDLAYQSARQTGQPIYDNDVSSVPSLAGLVRETDLIARLEESSSCGGICTVSPQVFTTGEMPHQSCKRPLLNLLEKGQSVTVGLLISALIVKTVALSLLYLLIFRKRRRSTYLPKFPMLIGPPPELPEEQRPDNEELPAEVSFSKPASPASRPPIQDEGLSFSSSSSEERSPNEA